MGNAIRKGDMILGHDPNCFTSHYAEEGSSNVFINGKPAHRVGDKVSTHTCTHIDILHGVHIGKVTSTGSSKVFINGKPACRVGDRTECGSIHGSDHSSNVTIG